MRLKEHRCRTNADCTQKLKFWFLFIENAIVIVLGLTGRFGEQRDLTKVAVQKSHVRRKYIVVTEVSEWNQAYLGHLR